jgi:hypothetical protein
MLHRQDLSLLLLSSSSMSLVAGDRIYMMLALLFAVRMTRIRVSLLYEKDGNPAAERS